jgi:hypothetical protein
MKQSPQLEFESSAFRTPEEDEDTSSGIYGRALAQWLSAQLRARGLPAKSIVAGDFGWCVPMGSFPHSLYVACARTEEKPNHWRVFAFAEAGVLTRLLGRDKSTESSASLFAAVKQILKANPAINNLHEKMADRPGR